MSQFAHSRADAGRPVSAVAALRRRARSAGSAGVGGTTDGYAVKLTGSWSDWTEIGGMAKVTSDSSTFEAWIQLTPGATAAQTILLVEGAVPRISVERDQLAVFWGQGYGSADTTPITDGRWHHIAVVFDRGTVTFYKDGKPLDSTPLRAPQTSGDSLQAGSALGSTGAFNGLIYDIRVWNVARTAADIAGNMLAVLTGREPGLVALCTFADGKIGNQVTGAVGSTHGAAQVVAASVPHTSSLPPAALAQQMHQQGISLTRLWDVVSVMSADRVNYLFGQQFVGNLQIGQNFPPVSGSVPLIDNTTVVFTDILLSYPLITFSPSADAATLLIDVVSGRVDVTRTANNIATVTSAQRVAPEDGFELTMTVPLIDMQGEVDTQRHVIVDITNASDPALKLGIGGAAAETTLGQYFLGLMKQRIGSWYYQLGTIDQVDPGNDDTVVTLVPTDFRIATQVDTTDPTDTGRVLLFIATKSGTGDGDPHPQLYRDNILPAGRSTALLVSSAILTRAISKIYTTQFQAHGATLVAGPADSTNALSLWQVGFTAGSVDLGVVGVPPGDVKWWSGSASGLLNQDTPVVIPLRGILVHGGGTTFTAAGQPQWSQPWAHRPYAKAIPSSGTFEMTATIDPRQAGTVDAAGNVTFTGQPSVTIDWPGKDDDSWQKFWSGGADQVGAAVAQLAEQALENLFAVPLPTIRTFAVSNLLFPGQHQLSFSDVYAPGDVAIFGDLQTPQLSVSPLFVTLTSGQQAQFTAAAPAGASKATWSLANPYSDSTIDEATGLYTALAAPVSATSVDVVTATVTVGGKQQQSSAAVIVVPSDVVISPCFKLLQGGAAPQQLVAASGGTAGTADYSWSMASPDTKVPAVGTLSPEGVYTPPQEVDDLQALIVTATGKAGLSGQALLLLVPGDPAHISISPSSLPKPLQPGSAQQFTAQVIGSRVKDQTVDWSVIPSDGGSITASGLYTAPAMVSAPRVVAVMAGLDADPDQFNVVPILLAPASDSG